MAKAARHAVRALGHLPSWVERDLDKDRVLAMGSQLLGFDRLTRREEEVLSSLMKGAKAREICAQSFVSMPTVRSQIRSILTKLGVSSQLAAVALAYQNGWSGRAEQVRGVFGTDERASA